MDVTAKTLKDLKDNIKQMELKSTRNDRAIRSLLETQNKVLQNRVEQMEQMIAGDAHVLSSLESQNKAIQSRITSQTDKVDRLSIENGRLVKKLSGAEMSIKNRRLEKKAI